MKASRFMLLYDSLDKFISSLDSDQKALLYAKVREIRARRDTDTDASSGDLSLRSYLREVYLRGCMEIGPEAGRKCSARSRGHYNTTPKGLYGHRYPSSGNLKRQKVKNAKGNVVMRPTIKYLKNVIN